MTSYFYAPLEPGACTYCRRVLPNVAMVVYGQEVDVYQACARAALPPRVALEAERRILARVTFAGAVAA